MSILAEGAEHASSVSPYAVGAATLVIFILLLLGLLAFGKGREHT